MSLQKIDKKKQGLDAHSARLILKDKSIDSLIEGSHPMYCDHDQQEYLTPVYKALKNLKKYLQKAAVQK